MKFGKHALIAIGLVSPVLFAMDDAKACGGCFVQQSENTLVSGHRMILSVSANQTTLWDQITYDGAPESFAWVLPIKGTVDVGLSSDALFQVLESYTNVVVTSPTINCPNSCGSPTSDAGSGGNFGAGGGGGEGGGGVTILEQEVVGPYETVQLAASDPGALANWLASHGYNIPPSIQPVIDSYVSDDFNFLALKLVPGQNVSAMRPVRITTPGAGPGLPLKMVAAGTGAQTPILLWVFGEGRYETTNFPSFTIKSDELVWDWDTASSNYSTLKQEKFDASNGKGWLVEAAGNLYSEEIGNSIQWGGGLVEYEDADGANAEMNLASDMAALYGNIPGPNLFSTRLFANLPQSALTTDLSLGASADQTPVSNYLYASKTKGTPPECPPDPCAGEGGGNGDGGSNWIPGFGGFGNAGGSDGGKNEAAGSPGGGGGCFISGTGQTTGMGAFGLGLAAAIAMFRRRRSRK